MQTMKQALFSEWCFTSLGVFFVVEEDFKNIYIYS